MTRGRLTMVKPRVDILKPPSAAPAGTKRTRGSAWMATRDKVFRRDRGLCQPCERAGRVTLAEQVDHILPLCLGGTDDLSNLEAICPACHQAKTAAEGR